MGAQLVASSPNSFVNDYSEHVGFLGVRFIGENCSAWRRFGKPPIQSVNGKSNQRAVSREPACLLRGSAPACQAAALLGCRRSLIQIKPCSR